jgi:hypothetical protein
VVVTYFVVVIARVGTTTTVITMMDAVTMVTRVTLVMIWNFQVLRAVRRECYYFDDNMCFIRRTTDSIFNC